MLNKGFKKVCIKKGALKLMEECDDGDKGDELRKN